MTKSKNNNDHLKGKIIDINKISEIDYWCRELACEKETLLITVMKVGTLAKMVDDFLYMNQLKKNKNAQ